MSGAGGGVGGRRGELVGLFTQSRTPCASFGLAVAAGLETVRAGCGVVPLQLLQEVEVALPRVRDVGVDSIYRERPELGPI